MHDNSGSDSSCSNVAIYNNTLIRADDYHRSPASRKHVRHQEQPDADYYYGGASLTPDANGNIYFRHDMMSSLFVDPDNDDYT